MRNLKIYDRQTIIVKAGGKSPVRNSGEYNFFLLRSNDSAEMVDIGFNGGTPSPFSVGDRLKLPDGMFIDDVMFHNTTAEDMEIEYILSLGEVLVSAIVQSEPVIISQPTSEFFTGYEIQAVTDAARVLITKEAHMTSRQQIIRNEGPGEIRVSADMGWPPSFAPSLVGMLLGVGEALTLETQAGISVIAAPGTTANVSTLNLYDE